MQIPISFYPSEISEYKCKLVIKLNEKIEWVYPIRVVTEATIPPKELVIQTICRKKKEKKFYVELPGIRTLNEDDKFDIRVTQLRVNGLNVMNSWLKIMHNQTEVDP